MAGAAALAGSLALPWISDRLGSFPSVGVLVGPEPRYVIAFLALAVWLSVRGRSSRQRRVGRWLALPGLMLVGGFAVYSLIRADSLIHVSDAMQPYDYQPDAGPYVALLGAALIGIGARVAARNERPSSPPASP
jgi:hypothetical protein